MYFIGADFDRSGETNLSYKSVYIRATSEDGDNAESKEIASFQSGNLIADVQAAMRACGVFGKFVFEDEIGDFLRAYNPKLKEDKIGKDGKVKVGKMFRETDAGQKILQAVLLSDSEKKQVYDMKQEEDEEDD